MASKQSQVRYEAVYDILKDQNTTVIAIIAAIVVVFVSILIYLFLRGRKSRRTTLLITGISDAGKTVLFSKLIYGKEIESYTSTKENSGLYMLKIKNQSLPLIDIPGNDRQRQQFWDRFKDQMRGFIFMVDSSKFQKEVKVVAEFLFSLLTDPSIHRSKLVLLIACNKQDVAVAKSCKLIQMQLEKELNTLRVTQAASLDSTDSTGQSDKAFLGKEGKNFSFSQLSPMKVEFVECTCKGSGEKATDIQPIQDWIEKVF